MGSDFVKQTMLIEFFRMCSIDVEAHNYLYREFLKHYVWNSQSRNWTKRKSWTVISSINIGKLITPQNVLNTKLHHLCYLTETSKIITNPIEGESIMRDCYWITFKGWLLFKTCSWLMENIVTLLKKHPKKADYWNWIIVSLKVYERQPLLRCPQLYVVC